MNAETVPPVIEGHRPGARNVFEVSPITYAGATWCECGYCLTAVSGSIVNVDKMLTRKHRKHAEKSAESEGQ